MEADSGWRIDKHVPVALLLAIAVQTGTGVWWAASISSNVASVQQRVDRLESSNALVIAQGQQIAAMDAKMSAMQENMRELKALVQELMKQPLLTPLRQGSSR